LGEHALAGRGFFWRRHDSMLTQCIPCSKLTFKFSLDNMYFAMQSI
jgi:hypothetical protein